MPSFAGLGKFFGRTASEGAAFAAGVAVAPVLSPVVREIENEANAKYASHPLSAGEAANVVAEDVEAIGFGITEASYNGVNETRFRALLGEVLNAPGIGELYTAFRRDLITEAMFVHGLRKAKLETEWDAPLIAMKAAILDPAVLANIVVRGLAPDQGTLAVAPPTATGKVPGYPVYNIDVLKEAQGAGLDFNHFAALVGIVGRPMSLHEAASAYFRGIIELADYQRAVSEGDIRNEWRDAILEQARQIPTAHDGVELRLRGWTDDAGMYAQTARHGMSKEDTDLLFLISGRPVAHNQAFIGFLRGGTYNGPVDAIPQYFLKSLQESNLRPEWYNLIWAGRYHYPPFFQTINALNKGWIDGPTAADWLLKQAYEPTAVKTIIDNVTGSKTVKASTRVTSAQTTLITAIRKAYLGGAIDDAEATTQLKTAGLDAATVTGTLAHWTQEKALEALTAPPPATPPVA